MPEVTWICELLVDSVDHEDSIEMSSIQVHQAIPEIWPYTNTHESAMNGSTHALTEEVN